MESSYDVDTYVKQPDDDEEDLLRSYDSPQQINLVQLQQSEPLIEPDTGDQTDQTLVYNNNVKIDDIVIN